MMRSLFSGVSGLKNHQTRMDVIGNNISNVNTTGFKSSRVTFADTLNQNLSGASAPKDDTLGGTNPKQIGLGSAVATVDLLFTDGSVQSTGKNTDLCLSGNGLFVVSNGNQQYYTRNGAFEFDAAGNYVMPGSGLLVQGWMAENGDLSKSGSGATTKINIPAGSTMEASASTTITCENNLKASVPTIVSATGGEEQKDPALTEKGSTITSGTEYNPVYLTLSDGRTVTASEYDAAWSYGYELTKEGDGVTGGAGDVVTLTLDDGTTAVGMTGTTYTVGGYYDETPVTKVGEKVEATETSPVTLIMSDGSTHTVTTGFYTIGLPTTPVDAYDMGDTSVDGYVKAYSISHRITKINVENIGGGTGVTFHVGGTASFTDTAVGDEVTPTSDVPVKVKLDNGYSFDGVEGTTYTVGSVVTSPLFDKTGDTIKVTAATSGSVTFRLEDDTVIEDMPYGTYSVGDSYTYTRKPYTWSADETHPITITVVEGDEVKAYHVTDFSKDGLEDVYALKGGDGPYTYVSGGAAGTDTVTVRGASGNEYEFKIVETGGFDADLGATSAIGVNGGTWSGDERTTKIASFTVSGKISGLTSTYGIESAEGVKGYVATKEKPVTLTMSDGSTVTEKTGKYLLGNSLPCLATPTVYDSLGNAFRINLYFTKTETSSTNGNTWTVSVANDGTGKSSVTGSDGSVNTITMPDTELHFDTNGHFVSGDGDITLTMTNGSNETQNIQVNLTALTQFASKNTVNANADGYTDGKLESVSIDSSGIITGTYDNGQRRYEAQIAIAQFNNAAGLTKTGDSLYQVSNNSGGASIKTAGDLGVKITPSALEMSNVDIANEFADMIITQRGFQSNSKMITVGDEMLETVINMKR